MGSQRWSHLRGLDAVIDARTRLVVEGAPPSGPFIAAPVPAVDGDLVLADPLQPRSKLGELTIMLRRRRTRIWRSRCSPSRSWR